MSGKQTNGHMKATTHQKSAPPLDPSRAVDGDPDDPRVLGAPCHQVHNIRKSSNTHGAWEKCMACGVRTLYTPRVGSTGYHAKGSNLMDDIISGAFPRLGDAYPELMQKSLDQHKKLYSRHMKSQAKAKAAPRSHQHEEMPTPSHVADHYLLDPTDEWEHHERPSEHYHGDDSWSEADDLEPLDPEEEARARRMARQLIREGRDTSRMSTGRQTPTPTGA